jgi:signal transduction histidine kinase
MPSSLDLAVGLAHDVRSPLGAIMALAELVETGAGGPVTETQQRLLGMMREAADGLARMTTDIVEGERRRLSLDGNAVSAFEVQEVLGNVRSIVQPMAEHSGLNVVMTNQAPRSWSGQGDAVTRVLLNLLTNALKYTKKGTVEYGALQLSATQVRFFVRDSGGGLPSQPVRPARRTRPRSGWKGVSSGLGLAISRALLDRMGSTLELESTPGEGCCFHFALTSQHRAAMPAQSASR